MKETDMHSFACSVGAPVCTCARSSINVRACMPAVTVPGPQAPSAEDQGDTATTPVTGLERPRRQAQPNKRYTGPEWNTGK